MLLLLYSWYLGAGVFCRQGEILQLSEKYVRSLARDTRNVIDSPYAGRITGYGTFLSDFSQ